MPYKEFVAEVTERRAEPITFGLGGHTFTVVDPFPMGSFVTFARAAKGDFIDQVAGVMNLLRSWVLPEERDTFVSVVSEMSNPNILNDILVWIVEEQTGRPTEAPSSSPPSQPNTGVS